MTKQKYLGLWLIILLLTMNMVNTVQAADIRQSNLWLNASAAEFGGWQQSGTKLNGQTISLDSAIVRAGRDPYGAGSFQGGNYYNGSSYFYGEALAPYYSPVGSFDSLILSWNARTPVGTWVELRIKALIGDHWSREYVMGIWSSDANTLKSHSLNKQDDADGEVKTDTLNLKRRATTFQVRAILFATNRNVTPLLDLVAVNTIRNGTNPTQASNRAAWGQDLAVPERSQMIYPDGGEVWCSPTSSSMVMAYWAAKTGRSEFNQTVPTAAARTYDWIYHGNGNWPFNTAYTASFGSINSYVTRMLSLSQLEAWIVQGVPVIVSIAYRVGQLGGTPISQSTGHLLVVRGFDRVGNVITNDPAADPRINQATRIVYNRAQFEQVWQNSSGGAAYLIVPQGWSVPVAQSAWADITSERLKSFADSAIEIIWRNSDQSVASNSIPRSWLWGPQPLIPARLESYIEAPGGERLVQYFDKSRMEITRPQAERSANWFVSNGLLTVELVTGKIQVGDSRYENATPAAIPVAGDAISPLAPTYATFNSLISTDQTPRQAPNQTGQAVTATLARNGQLGSRNSEGVTIGYYEPTLGHNVPTVFWSWMNDSARSGLQSGWLFALGYPISEPYWIQANLNNQNTLVLVQLFERRALTYTPSNQANFQIEMGNIGQHYLAWRY